MKQRLQWRKPPDSPGQPSLFNQAASSSWPQPGIGIRIGLTAAVKPKGLGGGAGGAFIGPRVAVDRVVVALVATGEGVAGWLGVAQLEPDIGGHVGENGDTVGARWWPLR